MMKKIFILICLFINLSFLCFSQEKQYYSMLGLSFGNLFEKNMDYKYSLGITMGNYSINTKKNRGFFALSSYNFALVGIDSYNSYYYVDQTFGLGFKYALFKKIDLLYGLGIHFMMMNAEYKPYERNDSIYYSKNFINIGICGNLNFKYNINYLVFINFGWLGIYDFFSYETEISNNGINKKSTFDYYMLGTKPYITVGLNAEIIFDLIKKNE
jgi:hypothetical protein